MFLIYDFTLCIYRTVSVKDDYEGFAPRVNIPYLPCNPKIKREPKYYCEPKKLPIQIKRTFFKRFGL